MRVLNTEEAQVEFKRAQAALGLQLHFKCLADFLSIIERSNLALVVEDDPPKEGS